MVVTPSGMTVFLQPETSLCSLVLIMALEPSGELYTVLPASTVMLANAGQKKNGFSPMEVTELGIVIEVRAPQLRKASVPIEITEFGISIEDRLLQPLKAELPMVCTEGGSVTAARDRQPEKASSLMLVSPVKYCNSLKVTLVPTCWKASTNTVPRLVTAAASA